MGLGRSRFGKAISHYVAFLKFKERFYAEASLGSRCDRSLPRPPHSSKLESAPVCPSEKKQEPIGSEQVGGDRLVPESNALKVR